MLRTRVRCRAVLALTATATAGTAAAVARVLDIPPGGVIRDDSVRSNLRMSVAHTNGGAFLIAHQLAQVYLCACHPASTDSNEKP
jgi:superfamily II DNA helicase RecQ